MVLAPHTVQEAVDLTYDSFELAERDRNPVLVLLDGSLGSVMEEVEFPQAKPVPPRPDWAVGNFNGGTHPQRIVASMAAKSSWSSAAYATESCSSPGRRTTSDSRNT